jgi:putative ABC transport system permease protein
VTQRTQEIGLRMALGARGTDVLSLVLRGSMKWVLAGLAFGIVGSIGIARALGTLLYGVRPADPAVLSMVSALLAAVALLASLVPARRAANLDPMRTLRHE